MARSFLTVLTVLGFLLITITPALADMKVPKYATQTATAKTEAEAAIAACDEPAYDTAMGKLKQIQKSLHASAKPGMEPYTGIPEADAGHDEAHVRTIRDDLKKAWAKAQPCGGDDDEEDHASAMGSDATDVRYQIAAGLTPSTDAGVQFSPRAEAGYDGLGVASLDMTAGTMNLLGSTRFLGSEIGGGGNRRLDIIEPDEDADYLGFSADMRFFLGAPNISNIANVANFLGVTPHYAEHIFWDLFFGVSRAEADVSDSDFGVLDVGAANDLLLPGVGGLTNPTGFNTGAGFGRADNMFYSAEYEFGAYKIGLGKTLQLRNERIKIRPFGGIEYSHLKFDEMFTGRLPLLGNRIFTYETEVTNKVISPFIGVEASVRPPSIAELFKAPIELNGKFRYAHNFNDADGRDSLGLTGFQTGSVDLSENEATHNIQAQAGVTINPDGPFSISLGGGYERVGNAPMLTRDGVGPSKLSFDDANVWTARFGIRYGF